MKPKPQTLNPKAPPPPQVDSDVVHVQGAGTMEEVQFVHAALQPGASVWGFRAFCLGLGWGGWGAPEIAGEPRSTFFFFFAPLRTLSVPAMLLEAAPASCLGFRVWGLGLWVDICTDVIVLGVSPKDCASLLDSPAISHTLGPRPPGDM